MVSCLITSPFSLRLSTGLCLEQSLFIIDFQIKEATRIGVEVSWSPCSVSKGLTPPVGLGSCQHLAQWMWAGPKSDHSCLVLFKNHWSWVAQDTFLIGLFTLSVNSGPQLNVAEPNLSPSKWGWLWPFHIVGTREAQSLICWLGSGANPNSSPFQMHPC